MCNLMHHFIENWGNVDFISPWFETSVQLQVRPGGMPQTPDCLPKSCWPSQIILSSFSFLCSPPRHFRCCSSLTAPAISHYLVSVFFLQLPILPWHFFSHYDIFIYLTFFLIPMYCQFWFHSTLQDKYGRKVWQTRYVCSAGKWNLTYWSHLFLLQLGAQHFTGRHLSYVAFIHFFRSTPTYLP